LRGLNGDRTLALGYIRREAGVPGQEAEIGGVKAWVSNLPFKEVTVTAS
jgi:hypothetical protein